MQIDKLPTIKIGTELLRYHTINIPDDSVEFLMDFIDSIDSKLTELERMILEYESDIRDSDCLLEIRRVFHSLKGEAGVMGFKEIHSICHHTETEIDNKKSRDISAVLLNVKDWIDTANNKLRGLVH